VTTLSNGQISTSIITPSAAAAQEVAATTPGQKLEVLPIGLGVFAGVSVIALIVVGLVTYERTKYRKVLLPLQAPFFRLPSPPRHSDNENSQRQVRTWGTGVWREYSNCLPHPRFTHGMRVTGKEHDELSTVFFRVHGVDFLFVFKGYRVGFAESLVIIPTFQQIFLLSILDLYWGRGGSSTG
jgi:hypothetical protein